MARQQTTRLREATNERVAPERVIDAKFKEVSGRRRTFWGRVRLAVTAIFWAAVIGFLIPPAWLLVQRIGEEFRP